MANKFSFPTDAYPAASGIAPEVLARILASPIEIPILSRDDPKPKGQWFLAPRRMDKGRKRQMLYLHRPDGKKSSIRVAIGSPNWRERATLLAQAHVACERDKLLARIAPEHTKVCDLLGEYYDAASARADRGQILPSSLDCYKKSIRRLALYLKDMTLDKVGPDFPDVYFRWAEGNGIAFNTAVDDLNALRRGANEALTRRLCQARVTFQVPVHQPGEKSPFTPPEHDRTLWSCLGGKFVDADTMLMVTDPETGEETPFRHPPEVILQRAAYFVAYLLDVKSGSRKTATCELSWVDVGGPWIDIDSGVLYRQGRNHRESSKRRGIVVLPRGVIDILRPIAEADIANGCIWVVHDADGNRLPTLRIEIWREILADACVEYRHYHSTKDTSITMAWHQKVSIMGGAHYFQTTPKTMHNNYGADVDLGIQVDVAAAMDREDLWRANHAANEARAATAAAARKVRAERHVPRLPAPTPAAAPDDAQRQEVVGLPAVIPTAAARPALAEVLAEAQSTFADTVTRARESVPKRARRVRPWPKHVPTPRWKPRQR